jgi:penicillin-binding protein 2
MIKEGDCAIEPKTGEIYTAPSYDPSILLVDNVLKLFYCITTPLQNLYDRGLLAEYPPGSPLKY